jgi:hypothetical protein
MSKLYPKTLVVNLFAGPGTGKSTTMAHVFAELKWKGYDCEMASEYAKDKVWEGSHAVLDDQFYVSGKQYHKMSRLDGKVEIIITDSPLLLGLYYGNQEPKEYHDLIIKKANSFNNFNIFLKRCKAFNPNGRMQTELEAMEIDQYILNLMDLHCPTIWKIPALRENVDDIVKQVELEYKMLKLSY